MMETMHHFTPVAALAACCCLVACSAKEVRPPDELVKAADIAVSHADDARVSDYAAAEFRSARDKLAAARDAATKARQENDPKAAEQARWLAEEAIADAQYSEAKAQDERDTGVARGMQSDSGLAQVSPPCAGAPK